MEIAYHTSFYKQIKEFNHGRIMISTFPLQTKLLKLYSSTTYWSESGTERSVKNLMDGVS